MARVRGCLRPEKGHSAALVKHIKTLQAGGSSVLVIAADQSYSTLQAKLSDAGVAEGSVWFLDAVSASNGDLPTQRPREVVFIQSPTMLEMVAMRVEQMQRLIGGEVAIVLDSLSALCIYNRPIAVEEFAHYLVNRLRTLGISGDLVVSDDEEGKRLQDAIAPLVDSIAKLGAN